MSLQSNYIPNVPQGNQQINNTQEAIKDNFQCIYDLLAVNHVPFNTPDDFGKHKYVSYYNQLNDPSAGNNQIVLYSKIENNSFSLLYKYPNSSIANQLVSNVQSSGEVDPGGDGSGFISIVGFASSGYQYLSGPILMIFGIFRISTPNNSVVASTTQTFSFASLGVNAAFTNTPFHIEVMPVMISTLGVPATSYARTSGFVKATPIDNLTFSITIQNSTSGSFQVLAIGI